MKSLAKKIIAAFFVSILAFFVWGFFESRWIEEVVNVVSDDDLPGNFSQTKIVFLADFHTSFFFGPDRVRDIVLRTNALNPDIVILGGDYIDYDKDQIAPCFEELAGLKAKFGVYGVLGNHDYLVDGDLVKEKMIQAGIKLLDNSQQKISIEGQEITIAGVSDFLRTHYDYPRAVKGSRDEDFVILASHNPVLVDKIKDSKTDLILSGHTHGGQVTFFGKWTPAFYLKYGQKYRTGYFEIGPTKLIVSNGVGSTILPLRFFSRPQINIITIN